MSNTTGALAGFGLIAIIVGAWWATYAIHRMGMMKAADLIFEDIRMYREDNWELYREKVPGLTEAMYIARYHSNHPGSEPTGLSRSRRPSPTKPLLQQPLQEEYVEARRSR